MKLSLPFARISRLLFVSLALCINATLSSFAAYEVSSVGSWTGSDASDPTTLSGALRQSDVFSEGIKLGGDITSDPWSNWATGTAGTIKLMPVTIAANNTLVIDLANYTLAGRGFSFVTGTGKLSIENGTLGYTGNDLYFGVDGAANVDIVSSTVNAKGITIGKQLAEGATASYNPKVAFKGVTANIGSLTIYTGNTKVPVDVSNPASNGNSFIAKDSTINVSAKGTVLLSGAGDPVTGYQTNDAGDALLQEYNSDGTLKVDEFGNPILVPQLDEDGNPKEDSEGNIIYKTVSKDYYYSTTRLIDSSLNGVGELNIEKGASLVLFGNSHIEAEDISITGSTKEVSSALRGSGTLTWTKNMTVGEGAWLDVSKMSVNGGAVGDMIVGKDNAQKLNLFGGLVIDNDDGTRSFKSTRFTLDGDLIADNNSEIFIKDAPRISGLDSIILNNGSQFKATGNLAYDPITRNYLPSTIYGDGELVVSGGSRFIIENGWRVYMEGKGTSVIDDSSVYIGIDMTAPPEDRGQGTLHGVTTQLNMKGSLTVGTTADSVSKVVILDGASMSVDGDVIMGEHATSTVQFAIDGSQVADSKNSSFTVGKDLVIGQKGHVEFDTGASGTHAGTKVTAGSTLMGAEAGSTATVIIDSAPVREAIRAFYDPTRYAWRVTGKGETDLNKMTAAGNSSLLVKSGLVFIDKGGVFSMGGQDASYANGYGIASFVGGIYDNTDTELRLFHGTFSNQGVGAGKNVGQINFTNGAYLSGTGRVFAGESISFTSSVLAPGSRFLYDDILLDENGLAYVIGDLDLYVNKPGGKVTIDGGSRISVALSGPSGPPENGVSSKVVVHNVDVDLSEGFVVDLYRIFEGSYKIMETTEGRIGGTYTGYDLRTRPSFFALNGNPLQLLDGMETLQSNRILLGAGNMTTYFQNNNKELWVDIKDIAVSGNVSTFWTGTTSNVWNMYRENWDTATTFQTSQFLDGDIVTFDERATGNRDIEIKTYGTSKGVVISEMNVLGSNDWSFTSNDGSGITAYNSELYTTLDLEDPDPSLRPSGRLNKVGTGTLSLHTYNEFYGGVHLGDANDPASTGGKVVLDHNGGFGVYDLSIVDRGASKGTVFTHQDTLIEATDKVKNVQNRFIVSDGKTLTLDVANDAFKVGNDFCYGQYDVKGFGGGAFHVEGTVVSNKALELYNSIAFHGGGLYLAGNGQIDAPSLTITNSFAKQYIPPSEDGDDDPIEEPPYNSYGGGIHANITGLHTLLNLTLDNNKAYGYGGGMYITGADSTMTLNGDISVTDNQSVMAGGGIYLDGSANQKLILDLSSGSALFEGNLVDVGFKDPTGGNLSLNPRILLDSASSNAVHVGGTGTLDITGSNHVYFYDPVTGSDGATINIGTGAADSVKSIFHGFSGYAGTTTVNGTSSFRLEKGDTRVAGHGVDDALAAYGVSVPFENGVYNQDYTQWTAIGQEFTLTQNATITGSGVIGGTTIHLDGNINLDDGSQYDETDPTSVDPDTFGVLSILGNVSVADTANWYVTLGKGSVLANSLRPSDQIQVGNGSATFTGTDAADKFDVHVNELVHGKYALMTTKNGITGFNTDKKLSGTPVWWEAPNGSIIDLSRNALTSTDLQWFGRARAITYAEGNNLYLNVTARNRHVRANQATGVWSDNDLWEFDNDTGLPVTGSPGNLTTDWQKWDNGPATNLFINGDMVTFSPDTEDQRYTINGYVRPVDMFVAGSYNVSFDGTGGISSLAATDAAAEGTSIRPDGTPSGFTDADNDYLIPLYTGKLYKTTGNILTFTNTGNNTFAEGIQVGGVYTDNVGVTNDGSYGGIIQFSRGEQLLVGNGRYITFIGDGTLRNTATTTLYSSVYVNTDKTATFDVGTGLTLTEASNRTITGEGAITKINGGRLVVTAVNAFQGGATFGESAGADAGIVDVRADNSLGALYTGADKVGRVDVIGKAVLTKDGYNRRLSNHFYVAASGSLNIDLSQNSWLYLQNVNRGAIGNGGAIYVESGASDQLSVTGGNGGLQMLNNKANGGGAIYTGHTGILNLSAYVLFSNNEAIQSSGGAIWSAGDVNIAGGQISFSLNKAYSSGGAIFASGRQVSLTTTRNNEFSFRNNTASMGSGGAIYARAIALANNQAGTVNIASNEAGVNGGAFYLDGGLLLLEANIGNIQFSGNTAANLGDAVYLNGTGAGVLTAGDKDVYFYDTVSGDGNLHAFTKNGTGMLFFGNETGESNNSDFLGTTSINEGHFRVVDGVTFGKNGTGTSFTLNSPALLTGGGTIGAATSTLKGIVSADSKTTVIAEQADLHSLFDIGTLNFDGDVVLNGGTLIVDMQGDPAALPGEVDKLGQADKLVVNGIFDVDSANGGTVNFFNFSFGHYLLVDSTQVVPLTSTDLKARIGYTIHGQGFTDRHAVSIVRGDDAEVAAANGGTDKQVWAKTSINNLYMYWSGADTANWNPYDTDSVKLGSNPGNENWVNQFNGSSLPAEGHIINADAVYFGDKVYDYATGLFSGTSVSRSSIAIHNSGVIVTDMLVDNTGVNYSFTGGGITTTKDFSGTELVDHNPAFTAGNAPQNLTKRGGGTLTFANSVNVFGGTIYMEGGTVNLNNTANTFTGGIVFRLALGGAAGDLRQVNFTTAAQLGAESVTFDTDGTLRALGSVELANTAISSNSGNTGTINVDSTKLVSLTGTSKIQGTGNLSKTGAGTLQVASGGSNLSGNTTISQGIFRVAEGYSYGAANAGLTNAFSQIAGTTLAGGGTINAGQILISGAVSPDNALLTMTSSAAPSGSQATMTFTGMDVTFDSFTFKYDAGTGNAVGRTGNTPTGDLISVNAGNTLVFSGNNVLDITTGTIEHGRHYLIVDADRIITSDGVTALADAKDAFSSITSTTGTSLSPRVGKSLKFGDAGGVNTDKTQIWLSTYRNSLNMTWTNGAANAAWDSSSENWISTQFNTNNSVNEYSKAFNDGDYVHFRNTAGTINLAGNVLVSGFDVDSAGSFTFAGTGSIHGKVTDASIAGDYVGTSLIPDGKLQKAGAGTLTMNNGENTFDGGLLVKAGTLSFLNAKNTFGTASSTAPAIEFAGGTTVITSAAQLTDGAGKGILFSGDATLRGASDVTLSHQVAIDAGKTAAFDTASPVVMTLSGTISGTGALLKTGTGKVSLTGASSTYSGGSTVDAGTLEITGSARKAGVSGSDVSIASGGTFLIGAQTGSFVLDNVIKDKAAANTGIMAVNNGGNFAFGSSAAIAGTQGTGFTGTVEMLDTIYAIDAITEGFFTTGGAGLTTRAGSYGTVADNSAGGTVAEASRGWDLKNSTLTFDGGTVAWGFDNHNDAKGIVDAGNIAVGTEDTVIRLDISSTFLVKPDEGTTLYPNGTSIFAAQKDTNTNPSLLLATSQTDISTLATSQLDVKLYKGGSEVTGTEVSQAIDQGAGAIADGVFDWNAIATEDNKLTVGFGLKRVEIYDNQTLNVFRNTGDGGVLNVVLTDKNSGGKGNVLISNNGGGGITLNAANSYTGTTTVDTNTTLTMGVDNALGSNAAHTSELIVNRTGSKVDLADKSQVIGKLTVGSGGIIDFNNGSTLSIDNGGTVAGANSLTSSGAAVSTLNVNGGTLAITGANASLKANVNIAAGATVSINDVAGIASSVNGEKVSIADTGELVMTGASGTFAKDIAGGGKVSLTSNADVTLSGDNSGFNGANSLFSIASGSRLTASEAKHIGLADLVISGQFIADNSADWTLDVSNIISGAGTLIKQNTGTLTITHANTGFTGNTSVNNGKLKLTANSAIGSGAVAIAADGILELAQGVTAFANNVSGSGKALVSGTGVAISGNNSGFTAAGQWEVTGTGIVTSQQNLGNASVFINGTDAMLSLATGSAGDFNFINVLTGTGTLSVTLTGADDEFSFNASAGTGFAGTLQLQDSSFLLSDAGQGAANAAALADAILKASSGSVTTVSGDAAIGGLTFDGGRVKFDVDIPPDAHAAGILDASARGIEITSNTGEVGISSDLSDALKAAFDNPTDPAHERNILDQDNAGEDAIKLAAGHVTGSANSLKLVDLNGNLITDGTLVNINEGGELAAIGTYDYSLAAGTGDEDLYVDYTLVQLDLQLTEDGKALTLNNAGATDNTLSAKITGAGNLAIEANSGEIVINNSTNDYTGSTTVRNGTLVSGSDNALGSATSYTKDLIVLAGAAFDLDGYEQNIGKLTNTGLVTLGSGTLITNDAINSTGRINLETGTLKVNAGGTISGNDGLVGTADSTLHVDPSDLVINGANTNFHGKTIIEGGSSVTLDHAFGLGDSEIELVGAYDILGFNITDANNAGASRAFTGTIKGIGELLVNAAETGGELYITSANSDFHGEANVEHGGLVVTDINGVGDSMIRVLNDDATFTWKNIRGTESDPATIRNDMSGVGTIAFDNSDVKIGTANTASHFALVNQAKVTLEHANALGDHRGAVSVDNTSHLVLGIDRIVMGNVSNSGLVSFAEPVRLDGAFKSATVTSLSGYGSILFNVDVPATTADHLTVVESTSGTQTVLVNWQPWGVPDGGNRAIPLIHTDNFISSSDAFKLPVNMEGKESMDVGSYAFTLRQGNGTELTPDTHEWYLVGDSLSKSAEAILGTAAGLGLGWHMEMDSLLKRMGDIRVAQYSGYDRSKHDKWDGWVRTYGMQLNAGSRISGSEFTEYYYGADLGMDKYFRVEEGVYKGHLYTGVFVGMGKTDRRFDGFGTGDTDMTRAGVYASYLSDRGWYHDLVAKFNYYDNTFDSTSTYGDRSHGSYSQKAMGFSYEVGRQFADKDNYFIEPQAQVSYGHIWGKNYMTTGTYPVGVSVEDQDTWQLRGGFRAGRHYSTGKHALTPYVKGSVVGMWTSGGRITTSDGMSRNATMDGARMEIGAGIIWDTRKNGQYYLDYEYIKGKHFDIPWRVNLGYRIQF